MPLGKYANVNGLDIYYEIHGSGRPLVLLHGSLSAIGTSFGQVLPSLAEMRQVIAVEQQAHGRTADVDRPLTIEGMAEDTAGLLEGIESLKPEDLAGSPFQEEYARTAPNPEDWPTLIEKVKQMDRDLKDWPAEAVQAIQAPTLLVIGDSDIVRPEHAVEMFRLLGGGVAGDAVGLPRSQLAVLPGTTHVGLVYRAGWLVSMIEKFLEAPTPGHSSRTQLNIEG